MRRVRPSVVASLVLSLSLVLVAGSFVPAAYAKGKPAPGPGGGLLLAPGAVVPGPGDSFAYGSFTWSAVRDGFKFLITVDGLDSWVQRIVIRRGAAGMAGPVVIQLSPNTIGINELQGTAPASRELLREIGRSPQDFYMEVTTMTYPNGALRGQLKQ